MSTQSRIFQFYISTILIQPMGGRIWEILEFQFYISTILTLFRYCQTDGSDISILHKYDSHFYYFTVVIENFKISILHKYDSHPVR